MFTVNWKIFLSSYVYISPYSFVLNLRKDSNDIVYYVHHTLTFFFHVLFCPVSMTWEFSFSQNHLLFYQSYLNKSVKCMQIKVDPWKTFNLKWVHQLIHLVFFFFLFFSANTYHSTIRFTVGWINRYRILDFEDDWQNFASLVAQKVAHCLPATWEIRVQSPGQGDPLEKAMAPHARTLAWKIPWTEQPGGLQSVGSQRVEYVWVSSLSVKFYGDFWPRKK